MKSPVLKNHATAQRDRGALPSPAGADSSFANGNGRHARLMADLLVMRLGGEWFSWGSANLDDAGAVRQHYIAALQAADNHDVGPLLAFARS
jgi:fido (protein-threonine AMPylation protein)